MNIHDVYTIAAANQRSRCVCNCACRRLWSYHVTKASSGFTRPRRCTCWVRLIRSAESPCTFSLIHILSAVNRTTIQCYTLHIIQYNARFPFKRNRLRCVNENRKKRKHLRCQAANHGCHCFDRAFLLAGASRNKRKRQPIGMLGRSSGNHDWLLANAIKRLRFLRFSFTQRTQYKRLRLNGNRA